MSYFIAEQYHSIKNIWENLLTSKKFINRLRFWNIIDINYLIDEIFKKQDILNISNISHSPIDYYIAATNAITGKVEYFSNHNNVDIFEVMRASKAMPFFFGETVQINNQYFIDSPNSTSIK